MRYISALIPLACAMLFFGMAPAVFAVTISATSTVNITAQVGGIPSIDAGSGGGGRSGKPAPSFQSGIIFSGYAYPYATVSVLKLQALVTTVSADARGYFTVLIPEDTESLYTLVATDADGYRSTLLNFPTVVSAGYISTISDIRFPPTIHTSASAIRVGDAITVSGMALPSAGIQLYAGGTLVATGTSSAAGTYAIVAPITFAAGDYFLLVRYESDLRSSKTVRLTLSPSKQPLPGGAALVGDLNHDGRVDIIDFSILAYWYGRGEVPPGVDLSGDGSISLKDFSILAYYWTE